MVEWVAYYLIATNFMTFVAFGIDKILAEGGHRRISEATLLNLSLIGGTPGAYAARHLFRHKTRKQPFSSNLHFIAGLQAVAITFGFTLGWETLGQFIANLLGDGR
jgi:uncharacterized membrane protein YsdA (DUF1294 family)